MITTKDAEAKKILQKSLMSNFSAQYGPQAQGT